MEKQQHLNVELNIPIPKDSVLIKKIELEKLEKHKLDGVWWTMADLEKRLGKKADWIKKHILLPTRFKEVLDVRFGGFVYYPERQGQVWIIHAKKMAEFLDENFHRFFE